MQNEEQTQDDSLETELEEVAEDTEEETTEEEGEQGVEYWKAEALKNKAILDRNKNKPKKKEAKQTQSDEFDYGEYAYLAQKGIESDDDIAFVRDSMKESGKNLRDVLNANWFKADLTERQDLSKTDSAVPKGSRANTAATDDVAYWASKPIEEVPANMRLKVVNARQAKEQEGGKFYNS